MILTSIVTDAQAWAPPRHAGADRPGSSSHANPPIAHSRDEPQREAPDTIRMSVKLAASMAVCFSATRQSKEFAAKASIATSVKRSTRMWDIRWQFV